MNYSDIIGKVSEELNLPKEVVDKTYKAFWLFINQSIQSLPLKENLNEEDFAKLRTNFNIPSLGKLNCTYDRMLGMKKRFKFIKQIRDKGEEMKKLFISQSIKGKTNEEIEAERVKAVEEAKAVLNDDVEVIDSFFKDAPVDARPLWFLGKSIELLSVADAAYFTKDWDKYRDCKIEHSCAVEYGIKIIEYVEG